LKADPAGVLTGAHYLDGDFACGEGAMAAGTCASLAEEGEDLMNHRPGLSRRVSWQGVHWEEGHVDQRRGLGAEPEPGALGAAERCRRSLAVIQSSVMEPESAEIPDATRAYHRWDDLLAASFRLALSPETDSDVDRERARERFLRGCQASLEERDAALARMIQGLRTDSDGR